MSLKLILSILKLLNELCSRYVACEGKKTKQLSTEYVLLKCIQFMHVDTWSRKRATKFEIFFQRIIFKALY